MISNRRTNSLLALALSVACGAGFALDGQPHRARGGMPKETRIDQPVAVDGGPRVFRTAHFEFEADQDVSKAFISAAGQVFEGTYEAVAALPLGIEPSPPEGMERFRAHFMKRAAFETEVAGRIEAPPGMQIAGAYLSSSREILVPYSSIGATRRGGRMTLRRSSDTTTLIHEITHQLMHDLLPLLPPWMQEGLAEYMAAVPYRDGRFAFRDAPRGLKERIDAHYQTDSLRIHDPGALIEGGGPTWSNSAQDYLTGMTMIYYFIHLDQGGEGAALSTYLSRLRQARDETVAFIKQHNDAVNEFERRQAAYNEAVELYNARLAEYRQAIDDRNRLIEQLEDQVQLDDPVHERVTIPDLPDLPKRPPPKPVVPKILEERPHGDGPIDVVASAEARARPVLLRGRDGEALARDVISAFAELGIEMAVSAH